MKLEDRSGTRALLAQSVESSPKSVKLCSFFTKSHRLLENVSLIGHRVQIQRTQLSLLVSHSWKRCKLYIILILFKKLLQMGKQL